ncbi:hypothetical protein M8C21_030938 [Ambrosia artemisiifolia]|uniref:Uncharacterized protein n=1 Tax=Ambrosia artemisiifolia TaxID=4212 RepID=A0AAD5DBC1_AMBAR|nr:hypothetical protein M8C21_030938 [Ambrosia artemisiifolia]
MGRDTDSLRVDKKPNTSKVNSNGVSSGTNHTSPKPSGESVNIRKSEAEEGPQVEPTYENQEAVSPKPEPSKSSEKIINSLEHNGTAGLHMSSNNSGFRSPINTKQSQHSPFSTPRTAKSFTDKYHDEEDNWSLASSAATSRTVKSRVTVGVAPSFKSAQRAAQRKEVISYLP